jgi:hypothetical protein
LVLVLARAVDAGCASPGITVDVGSTTTFATAVGHRTDMDSFAQVITAPASGKCWLPLVDKSLRVANLHIHINPQSQPDLVNAPCQCNF